MEKVNTFKIIKDGYVCEYSIKYDDFYDEFLEGIKDKYSERKENIKLENVRMSSMGEIIELRKYDEVSNKKVESFPLLGISECKLYGGEHYANVEFDGVIYPYIYKRLKYGFDISILEDLNVWMKSNKKDDDKNNDINKLDRYLRMSMKTARNHYYYSDDMQIENKNKLMEEYFNLIDFELVNKISVEGYKQIINNSIIVTPKVSEELEKQNKEIEENTRIIEESCFKDIINEKLNKDFKIKKGNQKIKK